MKKITGYTVLEDRNPGTLTMLVNEAITDRGLQPIGGIAIVVRPFDNEMFFMQAMVEYEA